MFKTACHCQSIILEVTNFPNAVTRCNCSFCYRIGVLWAYFTEEQVTITKKAQVNSYQWGKKLRTYHSCANCGCVTHYTQQRDDGSKRCAVNARMGDPQVIQSIPIRQFDGAGTFEYVPSFFT